MDETRVTEGFRLSLVHVKDVKLFISRMKNQPEFEDNIVAGRDLASLWETLNYSETLLNGLRIKAVAHALKKNRILPPPEL